MSSFKKITCPTCGKSNTWKKENDSRPFCSPRCKLMDLGAWADEQHRIAGEPLPDENDHTKDDEGV